MGSDCMVRTSFRSKSVISKSVITSKEIVKYCITIAIAFFHLDVNLITKCNPL